MVLFLFDVFFPPVFYFGCIKKKKISRNSLLVQLLYGFFLRRILP